MYSRDHRVPGSTEVYVIFPREHPWYGKKARTPKFPERVATSSQGSWWQQKYYFNTVVRVGSALVHAIRNGLIIHVTIGALTRGMPFVTSTEQRCILQAGSYITSGRQRRFSMRGPPLILVTTVHISLNPESLKEPRGNNNTSAIIVTG